MKKFKNLVLDLVQKIQRFQPQQGDFKISKKKKKKKRNPCYLFMSFKGDYGDYENLYLREQLKTFANHLKNACDEFASPCIGLTAILKFCLLNKSQWLNYEKNFRFRHLWCSIQYFVILQCFQSTFSSTNIPLHENIMH